MLNHRFFVVLGLIALLNNISPTPVSAQEKASTAAPAWASKCESISRKEALNCNVEQRVILQQTGQQVARMVIQVTAAEVRKPALLIHVPLGLSIRAGLTMTIDEAEPIKFDIQTCDASGCYAGIPVEDKLLASFKKGKSLTLEFENLNQKTISIPFSLEGFTAAYSSIE